VAQILPSGSTQSSLSDAPGQSVKAITPSDSTDFTGNPYRALYIGEAGDVAVVAIEDASNEPQTFVAVPAGQILPICVKRVMATNTTAGSILGIR